MSSHPSTPIRGMTEAQARRALGPCMQEMITARENLPKTTEAAGRMDEKGLAHVTNAALVTSHNVQLLIQQIVETTDDPLIQQLRV